MPADAERARELERLYVELSDAESRGLYAVLGIMLTMVVVAASVFQPALAVAGGMTAIGMAVVIVRALRRRRDVRAFCRDARLVNARIIPGAAAPSHTEGWYQELEIPDPECAVVARVKRRWPESSRVPDGRLAATWYAPTSSIVISFDPYGAPTLGHVEQRPLPRATLQR